LSKTPTRSQQLEFVRSRTFITAGLRSRLKPPPLSRRSPGGRQIRNDDEWRLLNGVLAKLDDRLLDEPTRELANSILRAYEERIPPHGKRR
jgi:hypothetical protein